MAKKLDSRLRGNDKMLFPQQELIIMKRFGANINGKNSKKVS